MAHDKNKMGRHMLLVSSGILFSKCLGLARDMVFAYVWGTGTVLAAFVLAFTVPNLLRALFGEGAFNAAFVPLFNERREKDSQESAWLLASRVLTVVGVALTVIIAILAVLAVFGRVLAPGELSRATFTLLPWVLPYGIFICIAAGLASILNSLGRFGVPAYAQATLNICLIAAALLIAPLLKTTGVSPIFSLAAAVLAAGILQVLINGIACARAGWRYRFRMDWKAPGVRRFGMLLAPILVGTGVIQLNVLVDRFLAGYLGNVATTTLYYSQRLVYLPVGLFGVAMGTVCLPAMSRAWSNRDREAIGTSLRFSLEQVLFFSLPAAVALGILRVPVVKLLFEHGDFQTAATTETAWTLMFYIGGIPAFVSAKIATTPFHARQDTKTPVKVAAVCVIVNVILNLILMQFLRQGGLALSTAIASWLNVSLLLYLACSAVGQLHLKRMFKPIGKIAVSTIAAGMAMHFSLVLVRALNWPGILGEISAVGLPALTGGMVYLGITFLLGCRQLRLKP